MQTERLQRRQLRLQANQRIQSPSAAVNVQAAVWKPNLAKRLLKGFTRETIAQAASDIDVEAVIVGLLSARARERG